MFFFVHVAICKKVVPSESLETAPQLVHFMNFFKNNYKKNT